LFEKRSVKTINHFINIIINYASPMRGKKCARMT
jgi:hypothetical protein